MSVFSDAEIQYLGNQRLGRLATVGHDGMPHIVSWGLEDGFQARSVG